MIGTAIHYFMLYFAWGTGVMIALCDKEMIREMWLKHGLNNRRDGMAIMFLAFISCVIQWPKFLLGRFR